MEQENQQKKDEFFMRKALIEPKMPIKKERFLLELLLSAKVRSFLEPTISPRPCTMSPPMQKCRLLLLLRIL